MVTDEFSLVRGLALQVGAHGNPRQGRDHAGHGGNGGLGNARGHGPRVTGTRDGHDFEDFDHSRDRAEEAEKIRADADRQRQILVAEAYRDAERIRGEGDAVAADTYAKAYKKDAEFYAFYRSLNAYRQTFAEGNDLLLIEPDSEFFQYFNQMKIKP